MTWIIDTVSWAYYDIVYPYLNFDFVSIWLMGGQIPLIVSLLIMNSLFLMNRVFNSAGGATRDWDSGASLVFQSGLIFGNMMLIGIDATARGWL